ncbi:Cell wall transcription factor ACE2 [Elsinoe australis]|uniref:Cell wall transcription factor ACE2 n=1 Tax=Elsinoe australis TaxID=40998 RepID=A0A2P8ADZ6_9PEZI|nr:Cell wall transcription factor ACE2 [Elsinoe australis]
MATPEHKWPRRSSITRSPDTISPLWPDRPIRPLPKNRLRSQLSPEQADSIVYPPQPPQSSPLFSFPYGLSESQDGRTGGRPNGHRHSSPSHCDCGGYHQANSDDEEVAYDHPSYRWSSPGADGAPLNNVQQKLLASSRSAGKAPPAPASIASSADGYESFENTSNKKKRKIPLSSGFSVHQSSLSADLANMGISSPAGAGDTTDQVNGTGQVGKSSPQHSAGSGTGISGAGRGRFGRNSGKPERRGGSNGIIMNGYTSSLSARSRGGDFRGDGTKPKHNNDQGIISAAIANAAGQAPTTPPKGKENVSLLSQEAEKSTTPKSQFTFTCETDASSKISWPLQGAAQYSNPPPKKNYYPIRQRPNDPVNMSQGTQTTPSRGPPDPRMAAPAPPPAPQLQAPINGQPPHPKPPRRRRPSKEFALAARQRRIGQEFNNYQHKPTKDSMWICEFCEYEDIWGVPPRALIRQYEIKDRNERKKAEERRRLLEKAKMKGKKGKNKGKGGKNASNPPPANTEPGYEQGMDNVHMPPDIQGDEYYDDDYDDGYDPVDPNDPAYGHDYQYDGHPGGQVAPSGQQVAAPPAPPPPA